MKNPQALPSMRRNDDGSVDYLDGMTLLDYFAGQVLSSFLSLEHESPSDHKGTASQCYYIAEAMLNEREIHKK